MKERLKTLKINENNVHDEWCNQIVNRLVIYVMDDINDSPNLKKKYELAHLKDQIKRWSKSLEKKISKIIKSSKGIIWFHDGIYITIFGTHKIYLLSFYFLYN